MMTDDEIAELFAEVVRELDPPVGAMVRRAEWIGRRRRARRRARIAAGNTLAISAVVGAGVLFGTHHASPGSARPLAGAVTQKGSASPSASTSPSPSPRASHTASPSPLPSAPAAPTPLHLGPSRGMTPEQMLVTLRSLLPAGSVLSNVSTSFTGPGVLEVDYNDGKGTVDFIVEVFPPGEMPQAVCPDPPWTDEGPRPAGALPISCATRTLPSGSVERDAVMYADVKGFYAYNIYDERPDGVTVIVQVGNGINHTLPQVDRAQPPGSMAEWEALAENPAWHV